MITITKIFRKANKKLKEKADEQNGINLDAIASRKIELIEEIKKQVSDDKIKRINYKVWLNQFDMIVTYLYENPGQTLTDITNKSISEINARSVISSWRAKKTKGKLPQFQEELVNMIGFEEYCAQMEQKTPKTKTK